MAAQVATNSAGTSAASQPQFVQLSFAPGVPILVIDKYSDVWAHLIWTQPDDPDGAGAFLGFNVTVSDSSPERALQPLTSDLSLTASGLVFSTGYSFHVYAVYANNASGSYEGGVAAIETSASALVIDWTSASGEVTTGNYSNDQAVQFIIRPITFSPVGVVVTFSLFDVECNHDVVYIYAENLGRGGAVFKGGCPRGVFTVSVDTATSSSPAVVVELVADHSVTGAGLKFKYTAKTTAQGIVKNSAGGYDACPVAGDSDECTSAQKAGTCTVKGSCLCSPDVIGESCTLPVLRCADIDAASPLCSGSASSTTVVSMFGNDETGLGEVTLASGGHPLQVKPFRTLRHALKRSQNRRALTSGTNIIVLMPGTYDTCDLDLAGDAHILSIRAVNDGSVVLACMNRTSGTPGFSISGRTVLSRVTVVGTVANNVDDDAGGVRVVNGGSAVFEHVTLRSSSARNGGALYVEGGAMAVLVDSNVFGNTAYNAGAGVYLAPGAVLRYGNVTTIDGCTSIGDGGGIFGGAGSVVNISASGIGSLTLTNNKARGGGGAIAVDSGQKSLPMTVIGVDVRGGDALTGGAVYVRPGGFVALERVDISGSTAVNGGGIYVAASGGLVAVRSTVAQCRAFLNGGGLFAEDAAGVQMDESRIVSCSAAEIGGGVFLADTATAAVMLVTGCAATSGGGVAAAASVSGSISMFVGEVRNCSARVIGGGAFVEGGAVSGGAQLMLLMFRGEIKSCSSQDGGGIGLSSGRIIGYLEKVNVSECTASHSGGAVFGVSGQSFVTAATIFDCTASVGGAVGVGVGATILVRQVSIGRCTAQDGGGAHVGAGGGLVLADGTFFDHCSASRGGGAFLDTSAHLDGGNMQVSQFSTCSAPLGGGVYCHGCSGISNTGVEQSFAAVGGGGIYVTDTTSAMIAHVACSDNTAASGGGMWIEAGVVVASDVQLVRNTAQYRGGGLAAYGGASVVVLGSVSVTMQISSNRALDGGNVLISGAGVELHGLMVSNGSAEFGGGGVHVSGATGAKIVDSTIWDNSASREGGGVLVVGGILAVSSIELENSIVQNNSAVARGGGISAVFGHVALSRGTTVTSNLAPTGCGVALNTSTISSADGGRLVSNSGEVAKGGSVAAIAGECLVSGVRMVLGHGYFGGGVYVEEDTTLKMRDAVVDSCEAVLGGAAFVEATGLLTLDNCMFSGNSASYGGGTYLTVGTATRFGATLRAASSSFDRNRADYDGGAIQINGGNQVLAATAFLNGCTFSNNHAVQSGGSIDVLGQLRMFGGCVSIGNTASQNGGHVNVGVGGFAHISSSAFTGSLKLSAFSCTVVPCTYTGPSKPSLVGEFDARAGAAIAVSGPYLRSQPSLLVTGSSFNFHVSADGGTITAVSSAVVIVNETTVFSNFGGGVRSASASTVVMSDSSIFGNSAKGGGGGAQCSGQGSTLRVSFTTFSHNLAGSGGALSVESNGFVNVTTSRFLSNSAVNSGGAVMVREIASRF